MAGLPVFLTALSLLGRIGTVVAHVLLSPMKLVGAAVSKTDRSVRLRPSATLKIENETGEKT